MKSKIAIILVLLSGLIVNYGESSGPGIFMMASMKGGGGGGETIGSTTIGAATNGGFYAGTIVDGGVTYHLIAAPKGAGDPTLAWDSVMYQEGMITTGIASTTAGPANTAALAASGYGTRHTAALLCDALDVGGKTDWYLPAKAELAVLYAAKAAFAAAGQAFVGGYYWSSTECAANGAWSQYFGDGYQYDSSKGDSLYVRAVRRLAI